MTINFVKTTCDWETKQKYRNTPVCDFDKMPNRKKAARFGYNQNEAIINKYGIDNYLSYYDNDYEIA